MKQSDLNIEMVNKNFEIRFRLKKPFRYDKFYNNNLYFSSEKCTFSIIIYRAN